MEKINSNLDWMETAIEIEEELQISKRKIRELVVLIVSTLTLLSMDLILFLRRFNII